MRLPYQPTDLVRPVVAIMVCISASLLLNAKAMSEEAMPAPMPPATLAQPQANWETPSLAHRLTYRELKERLQPHSSRPMVQASRTDQGLSIH